MQIMHYRQLIANTLKSTRFTGIKTILSVLIAINTTSPIQASSFKEIERRVWLDDERSFADIENIVVAALQNEPNSAKFHYLLSHLFVRRYSNSPADMNLLKKASELAQQAIDLSPKEEYGYVIIAEVLDIMGQTPNALKMLDSNYNPLFTPGWRTWFMRAKLKSDRLNNNEVLKILEKSMLSTNSQPEIISPYVIAVINASSSNSRIEKELADWDKRFPNFLFKESRALALARQKKYKAAHTLYVQTYSPKFDRVEALLNDAIILHSHLRSPRKAETLLQHITKNLKEKASNNTLALAYANLGVIQLKYGRSKVARDSFVSAITLADNRYEILEFITKSFRSQKKFRQLEGLIRTLNDEIPGSGILYALLGETLSEDLHDHDQALESFANAIVLEPKRSDFYNGMGLTYYRQNMLNKALYIFYQASKVDPDDAIARYNIACILSRLERPDEALLALKEAVSLDPRLIDNAKSDADFNNIRSRSSFADIIQNSDEKMSH